VDLDEVEMTIATLGMFAVSPQHTTVIPKRHVASLSTSEWMSGSPPRQGEGQAYPPT